MLIRHAEGRSVAYLDAVTRLGRTIATRRDPHSHHGSHSMPAMTRFLAAFRPALRDWAVEGAHTPNQVP